MSLPPGRAAFLDGVIHAPCNARRGREKMELPRRRFEGSMNPAVRDNGNHVYAKCRLACVVGSVRTTPHPLACVLEHNPTGAAVPAAHCHFEADHFDVVGVAQAHLWPPYPKMTLGDGMTAMSGLVKGVMGSCPFG